MRSLMMTLGVVVLASAGCYGTRSASPTFIDTDLTTVSPSAICAAQHSGTVTFASHEFDPGEARSQPPTVRLDLRVRNDGSRGPSLAFQLADDAGGPVRWSASGLLRFELSRQIDFGVGGAALPAGLYDVVAQRGDERPIAAPRGLAVVEPPRLQVATRGRCSDGSQGCVDVHGAGFLRLNEALPLVRFVPESGGAAVEVAASSASNCLQLAAPDGMALSSCTHLAVTPGALPAGSYRVSVRNPAHTGCVSEEPVRLTLGAASQSPRS